MKTQEKSGFVTGSTIKLQETEKCEIYCGSEKFSSFQGLDNFLSLQGVLLNFAYKGGTVEKIPATEPILEY